MKCFISQALIALGLLLHPSGDHVFADQQTSSATEEVVAEGVGLDQPAALKDAIRNAVRQVVGTVVAAETVIENDELIEDKVLTYSGGFVKECKEISSRASDGLVRTKIRATVERNQVIAKLRAANITMKAVDGKGMFAEIVTKLDSERDATALIAEAIKDFPLNCLEATVNEKPELIDKTSNGATVRISVRYKADAKAYKAFSERLQQLLAKLAKATGEESLIAERNRTETKRGFEFDSGGEYSKLFSDVLEREENDTAMIALNDMLSSSFGRTHWKCYFVDPKTIQPLLASAACVLTTKLTLLDQDEQPVGIDVFPAISSDNMRDGGACYASFLHPIRRPDGYDNFFYGYGKPRSGFFQEYYGTLSTHYSRQRPVIAISPVFFGYNSFRPRYFPELEVKRELKLSLEEISQIHRIKCELLSDTPLPPTS